MANPARNFVGRADQALADINNRQCTFRRSQSAHRRLEKARDIVATGRAAILYHGADMQDNRVQKAQDLMDRIDANNLDKAITFGTV